MTTRTGLKPGWYALMRTLRGDVRVPVDTAHLPDDWEQQPDEALLLVHVELELAAGWDGALQDVTGGYTCLGLYHPDHKPEPC